MGGSGWASRGAGQAGAKVAVLGRNTAKSEAAAAADPTRSRRRGDRGPRRRLAARQIERAADRVLEKLGRADILFNNAGINIRKPPHEMTLAEWNEVLNANLTSAFLMSKAVYPAMKRQGGGKIINIGSMTSIFGAASRRRTPRARAASSS